jgi:hypothetical protein
MAASPLASQNNAATTHSSDTGEPSPLPWPATGSLNRA